MAQKVVVSLLDDLDQSEADETVEFGVDGASYEIDLSDDNAAKLRDILAEFVAAARRTGGARRTGRKNTAQAVSVPTAARPAAGKVTVPAKRDREQVQAIRNWSAKHGRVLSERGRIPVDVEEAYAKKDPSLLRGGESAPEPAPLEDATERAELEVTTEATEEAPTSTESAAPDMTDLPATPRELTPEQKRVIVEWGIEQEIIDGPVKLTKLTKDLLGNYKATAQRNNNGAGVLV